MLALCPTLLFSQPGLGPSMAVMAAQTFHGEIYSWKVPMCSRDFAQRNLVMESTNVQHRLSTEKPSHGKYPCAAEIFHGEIYSWKVPMRSKDFAQRNLVMVNTHVQQRLCTKKPGHGKYPCAAETLHRET